MGVVRLYAVACAIAHLSASIAPTSRRQERDQIGIGSW